MKILYTCKVCLLPIQQAEIPGGEGVTVLIEAVCPMCSDTEEPENSNGSNGKVN